MSGQSKDEIREVVRERYAEVAEQGNSLLSQLDSKAAQEPASGGCCGPSEGATHSDRLGYSSSEQQAAPEGSNLGLGCGNPQAIASLKPGETVLDLGSGAGFDAFLASPQVGAGGHVIGVDMTPEMNRKARENATKGNYENVEFRLGEIEHMPVADNTVDAIISNCVINLSPDKPAVFSEAFRVLKPGGRLAVSDVVATAELPAEIRNDLRMLTGCIGGAAQIDELTGFLEDAGFTDIRIEPKSASSEFIKEWKPGSKVEDYVQSATIEAVKPA